MKRRFIPALVILLALVGCGPKGPEPTPTPSSASPTPSVSASPDPRDDPLYQEAERVLRASLEAQSKYTMTGDYSTFPPELADYYSADYLPYVRGGFDQLASQGIKGIGEPPVMTLAPLPGVSKQGSEVAVHACIDARHVTLVDREGSQIGSGSLSISMNYLRHEDGKLKIFAADVREGNECPFG